MCPPDGRAAVEAGPPTPWIPAFAGMTELCKGLLRGEEAEPLLQRPGYVATGVEAREDGIVQRRLGAAQEHVDLIG